MTIDALANVFPEDWPQVLANLRAAVRPGAYLYLTVEEVDAAIVDDAFASLAGQGLPAVRGEVIEGDVAGYHYYPGRPQVDRWLRDAGLDIIADETETLDDWGLPAPAGRIVLMRAAADPRPARSTSSGVACRGGPRDGR